MIRAVAVAAVVLVAVLVAPAALGSPAFNSADIILILSPAAVLAVGWPRRSRPPVRAVSEHYEASGGAAAPHSAAPPPHR